MIPKDPILLLSFLNLKLRDFYPSLSALCEDLDIEEDFIRSTLHSIGYHYDEQQNRFL